MLSEDARSGCKRGASSGHKPARPEKAVGNKQASLTPALKAEEQASEWECDRRRQKEKTAAQQRDRDDARRQRTEESHAREIARAHGRELIRWAHCEYAATVAEHQAAQLTFRDDSWVTEERLVAALVVNDQPITRKQLRNLVDRHGLPREKRPWPRWVNSHLQSNDVWQYRVGDVRDLTSRTRAGVAVV